MLLSILTFILGVVGSYLISRNFEIKAQIRMDINSFGIINDSIGISNVTLECNGTKIDTLTKTSVMFWNSGRKCITRKDILGDPYMKIEFSQDVEIFECKIIKNNEKSNKICIFSDNNVVLIEFEYLKPGNGAIIDILHNGDINKEITPCLNLVTYNKNDVIKADTKVGWESIIKKKEYSNFMTKIVTTVLCICFVVGATVFSIFVPLLSIKNLDIALLTSLILEFICGGLFILIINYIKKSIYIKPKDLY